MNLFEIFLKGGVIMWAILFCSVVALAVAIDRFLVLRRAKINLPAFLVRIRGFIKNKDMSGAASFCLREKSPIGNMVRKGLKKFGMGHERVKEAIESAGRQEINKLEKGLSVLATIAGVAPLLGFLGTVTGMISAFMRIEDLQGSANPSDLAGGIWEALLTTAFGLAVGILAYTFYNYLVNAINKFVLDIEIVSNDVVDIVEAMRSGDGQFNLDED